jgi:hypothetical protein
MYTPRYIDAEVSYRRLEAHHDRLRLTSPFLLSLQDLAALIKSAPKADAASEDKRPFAVVDVRDDDFRVRPPSLRQTGLLPDPLLDVSSCFLSRNLTRY